MNVRVMCLLSVLALGCTRPHESPPREQTRPAPVDPRAQAGAATYAKYCALCHGADAKGYAADHAPSLVSSTFLSSATDEFLVGSIQRGRPGTAMAGYDSARGGPLSEAQVRELVAHLRTLGPRQAPLPSAPARGTAVWGEELYQRECQECHGTRKRRGTAPWLANPEFLSLASDEFLRHAITHGRPGTEMRPFAGALHAEQIEDLVSMLRAWQSTPPEPAPVPPAMPGMEGPIVINPKGRAAEFTARDGRFVPIDDVKRALDQGRRMIILDARATSDWLQVHVKGAVSAPYYEPSRLDAVPDDGTWVLAYCACPHHASGAVVDELKRRGYPNAAIMDEGILEWQNRKYPVVRAKGTSPPPAPPRR